MKELDLIKQFKKRTLEEIISRYGGSPGGDLQKVKVSIWDVKEVIYKECLRLAEELVKEEFA